MKLLLCETWYRLVNSMMTWICILKMVHLQQLFLPFVVGTMLTCVNICSCSCAWTWALFYSRKLSSSPCVIIVLVAGTGKSLPDCSSSSSNLQDTKDVGIIMWSRKLLHGPGFGVLCTLEQECYVYYFHSLGMHMNHAGYKRITTLLNSFFFAVALWLQPSCPKYGDVPGITKATYCCCVC